VVTLDGNTANPLTLIPHYQQEDLVALGKLVLALACRSLIAVHRDNMSASIELITRSYSSDLRNLILYVCDFYLVVLRALLDLRIILINVKQFINSQKEFNIPHKFIIARMNFVICKNANDLMMDRAEKII